MTRTLNPPKHGKIANAFVESSLDADTLPTTHMSINGTRNDFLAQVGEVPSSQIEGLAPVAAYVQGKLVPVGLQGFTM